MPTISAIGTNASVISGGGISSRSYWTTTKIADKFLYDSGEDATDILNKVVGGHLPNLVTGSVDYLTVTGTGLNARYRTPNNDTYRTADSDYAFWKTDASESICDGNRLVGYDFPRIIIKCLDVAPYTILRISILKTGVILTATEINHLHYTWHLPFFWSGSLNLNGYNKQNRPLAQKYDWTPEAVTPMPTGLTLTLISGGVKYDWTDTNSGNAQTEIWCRNDSDAYTTVTYTINAGIVTKSETINPVDLRYCKIRAKIGSAYSDFTAEQSIAMLGSELIVNGAFDDVSGWNFGVDQGWDVSGGKANWAAIGFNANSLWRTGFTLANYTKCRVKFSISGGGGSARLSLFINGTWSIFLNDPYLDGVSVWSDGDYVYYPTTNKGSSNTGIYFVAYTTGGGVFSIDNISLKVILFP